ncbi:MAG: HAD family phosphatase [Gemmiger sp.]|nr:HAD family phosphatase [Gemmiger sp.]
MVKGVIFDMDGLMFDTERIWTTLWAPACQALGLPAPSEDFIAKARGMAGQNMLRHIAAAYPGTDPQRIQDEVFKLGYEHFAKHTPLKPGLTALLAYLEEVGMPRIVASSSPRGMVERNLQNTGTARYFHDIVCGPEVPRSKPDPAIFLEAARRLRLPATDCLVLEDSFNGIRAGHAAGAVTVMVPDLLPPTEEIRALCSACCSDLFEVLALLKAGRL